MFLVADCLNTNILFGGVLERLICFLRADFVGYCTFGMIFRLGLINSVLLRMRRSQGAASSGR
jgi:hypothetical protein